MEQSGFSASGAPHDCDGASGSGTERDVMKSGQASFRAGVDLRHLIELEHGRHDAIISAPVGSR